MDFEVRVDAAATEEAFKRVRGQANDALKKGMVTAAQREVVPTARRLAPRRSGRLAGSITARPSRGTVMLTTTLRGKQARVAGLLEFGGTVRKPVRPRRKWSKKNRSHPAAVIVNGQPVAAVTAPRHYRARHFLATARDERIGQWGEAVRPAILKAFADAGFDTGG